MLNKKRTNNVRKVKYLTLIPMAAGLLMLNSINAMARVSNEKVAKVEVADPLPPEDNKVYRVCDFMPEFPGGQQALLQYLSKTMVYPVDAQQQKKQGRVVVSFIIEKDGSITDAKVARSLFPSLDKESLRVINAMPKWTPGKMKSGQAVRVQYTVPLTYRLQ